MQRSSENSTMPFSEEQNFKVGRYSAEERKEKISKYRAKRNQRNFTKTIKVTILYYIIKFFFFSAFSVFEGFIVNFFFWMEMKYACRKTLADSRPRIRGRFARNDEVVEIPNIEDDDSELWVSHIQQLGFFSNIFNQTNTKENDELVSSYHISGSNLIISRR